MSEFRFEWDESKSVSNLRKHGVSFREASTVFYDPLALVIDDPDHSFTEERFVILGISQELRLLVVVHCYRQQGDSIRLISARKATRNEMSSYGGGRHG